jgi:hypothetical protein
MAQTGFTPIQIYSSSTAAAAPVAGNLTNSTLGSELAINITDGKLFYKDNANAIQVIAWKTTPTTAGGTGLTSYAAGDLLFYATGTALSKLTIGASATVLTSSGSAPQWTAQSALSVGTAANLLSNATTGVMQIAGPGTGTTRVMTIPNANFTAARTDAAQSFTGNQSFLTSAVVGPDAKQANNGFEVNVKTAYSGFIGNTGFGVGGTPINPSTNYGLHIGYNRSNGNAESNLVWGSGIGALSDLVAAQWNGTTYSVHTIFKKSGELNIANGNLEIGTSGKGIDFSGVGTAAEILDDYEEGTFTPTAGFVILTSATGKYTKIGRAVHFVMEVTLPVTISTAGARFGGLPFTASADNYACAVWTNKGAAVYCDVSASGTQAGLYYVTTGGIYDYVDFSGDSVRIAGTYFI